MAMNDQSYRVWSRFERRKKDGTVLKLRIQDTPSYLEESVLEFNVKYFAAGESFQKASGVANNPAALEEYREGLKHLAASWRTVICCSDNDCDTVDSILGVSGVALVKDDSMDDFQTKEMQALFGIIIEVGKLVKDVKKEFQVFYDGRGITVHPEYRCLGIASEFVKIRRLMINEENIPMTCAWMTSYGSQKAAEKDNWETAVEILVEELGQNCGVVFKDGPPTFKFMLARAAQTLKN